MRLYRRSWDWGDIYFYAAMFVAGGFIILCLVALAMDASDEREEDEREVRRFGKMECIYNVTEDVVESCVEVER